MKRRLTWYLWKTQATQGEGGATAGYQVDGDYQDGEDWKLVTSGNKKKLQICSTHRSPISK